MIVTKKSLPRRTFLRGMGVTVALPFLDAMVPARSALAETPARPVPRLGFIYIPNGTIQSMWVPATTGAAFELSQDRRQLEGRARRGRHPHARDDPEHVGAGHDGRGLRAVADPEPARIRSGSHRRAERPRAHGSGLTRRRKRRSCSCHGSVADRRARV